MRHFLPVVLVLVVASATPAPARKWSSRSGGFSIEAELLDVRDGNAVLKKEDGTEVSVPLAKLSLADIRYVDSVLKSAEAGLGLSPAGGAGPSGATAAPSASASSAGQASSAKTEPVTAKSGVAARRLRYDWKPGQTFSYRVKMTVQLGTGPVEIQGTARYTVKSVSPEGVAEITFGESMTRSEKGVVVSSGDRYAVPARPLYPHVTHSRYYYPGRYATGLAAGPPEVVKVDRDGQIVSMEGGVHFPCFLGRAAHLPFEPLSAAEENPWTVATDIAFRMSKVDWLPTSMLASVRQEELPGREKAVFSIESSDPKQITVKKTYEASSAAQVEGKPQIALGGEGKLTFDLQRGLVSSSTMKIRVAMHDGAVLVEVPIQVSYEVVGEAEEAKMRADAEKTVLDREKLVKDLLRPLTVADLDGLVKDLQSGDHVKAIAAKTRLTFKKTQEPDRKMAAALEALLKHENANVREAAAEALANWATKENVPALVKLLDSDSPVIRSHALRALGRLKATTAIDRIVQQLAEDQFTAAQALREMGAAAEPAVLKVLATGDRKSREQACQILNQIGTKKSLPALEKAKSDADALMKIYAEQAIKAIQHRQ